ncbi:MAG: energy transducer TonB [Bacteroidetes bacterium]|nr:energy transducer TonB [Bacteroidota bacterium]
MYENIKYPEAAKSDNIQGTTYIEFYSKKSGKIKNVTVKKAVMIYWMQKQCAW